jgi:hypothetical protein
MNNVKLPNPPSVCPPEQTGLSDIRDIEYKGPRVNKANLMFKLDHSKVPVKPAGLADIGATLPDSFNWRDNRYVNIETPRDQGQCGSCWAFSSTTALGDRYAVKFGPDGKIRGTNLATSTVLGIKAPKSSTAWTLSCSNEPNSQNGCGGGLTSDAFTFFGNTGAKMEACWPYSLVQNNPAGQWLSYPCLSGVNDNCCNSCCNNPMAKNKLYTTKLSNNDFSEVLWLKKANSNIGTLDDLDVDGTILNIKKEIYAKGPVVSAFSVYMDFFTFWNNKASNTDEVYIADPTSGFDGGHAIVIVGWGTNSKGINYWLIRNSWGTSGGDGGYFRMACSNQISDKTKWVGIDVPTIKNNNGQMEIMGGALTFDIPDSMQFKPEKYIGDSTSSLSSSSDNQILSNLVNTVSSPFGISIIVGIFVIILLVLLYKYLRK